MPGVRESDTVVICNLLVYEGERITGFCYQECESSEAWERHVLDDHPESNAAARLAIPGAVFSPDRVYRYTLVRQIRPPTFEEAATGVHASTCTFIGLNPSTADEVANDPTVRRCIGYARRWGYAKLVVLNLFALRATDPRALREARDPVGRDNDVWLTNVCATSDLVVAAWGMHGAFRGREARVREKLEGICDLHVLATTKDGHPRHPLYLRADLDPVLFYDRRSTNREA